MIFLLKNFKHVLTLETTFSGNDSPERDSSIQPRMITSEYCLIFNKPYEMFSLPSFLCLLKGAKRIGFALFSPKWILNLFFTSQSQMFAKFLISWCSITLMPLCWKIRPSHHHKVESHNLQPTSYHLRKLITNVVLK